MSYAHSPPHGPNKRDNPNRWVAKLFEDLCGHIVELTNLADVSQAGYMDTGLRTGHNWQEQLAQALSTCRVFVPLYSPRYFESENCGREWRAFLQRVTNHTGPNGQLPEAIVPALWIPVSPERLPTVARNIQFTHQSLGVHYQKEGFYGLTKLSARRAHYQTATLELAKRIVNVAHRTLIAPTDPLNFGSLKTVFDDYVPERPLKITVAAPYIGKLPAHRNPYYYGLTPSEWNPYRNESNTRSLAAYAAEIAVAHGFLPEIGSLGEHAADLISAGTPAGPSLILVDPWATANESWSEILRRFDQLDRPWVSVVVPWNNDDRQTHSAAQNLRRSLDEVLRDKLNDSCSEDVSSLAAFGRALPDALSKAANHFFKSAPAYPPTGPPRKRPRLMDREEP